MKRPQQQALAASRRRGAALGVGVGVRVDVAVAEPLHIVFPCPVPARGNEHLGGRTTAHWSGRASLAAEQKARTRCAVRWLCVHCRQPAEALRRPGHGWGHAFAGCLCSRRSAVAPRLLPPMGPEHPIDVLLVRVRAPGGRPLDGHDGLPYGFKAVIDGLTEAVWPRDERGRPIGKPNDSVDWLRFCYAERPRRGEKPPSPSKRPADYRPGPPDPPAETELVELVIAPRQDCGHNPLLRAALHLAAAVWERPQLSDLLKAGGGEELRRLDAAIGRSEAMRRRSGGGAFTGHLLPELLESCGCGESTLLARWRRGEL